MDKRYLESLKCVLIAIYEVYQINNSFIGTVRVPLNFRNMSKNRMQSILMRLCYCKCIPIDRSH